MSTPQTLDRTGLAAALACYAIWGLFPLVFHAMGAAGAGPWEIVACRTLFAAPFAGALVLFTGKGPALAGLLKTPAQLGLLALSAAFIMVNWSVYVIAVEAHHTLAASLGYYLNPLFNAAVGAFLFKERITTLGKIALGLAAVGVAIQAAGALDALVTPLVLAASFSTYGVIRRQTTADAQTGLLVECLLLTPLALWLLYWLGGHGGVRIGHDGLASLLLFAAGPATVLPLTLFAFAARRLPFNIVGFIQFLCPFMQFGCGLLMGERLNTASLWSFAFIWLGAGVFAFDLVRRLRRESAA